MNETLLGFFFLQYTIDKEYGIKNKNYMVKKLTSIKNKSLKLPMLELCVPVGVLIGLVVIYFLICRGLFSLCKYDIHATDRILNHGLKLHKGKDLIEQGVKKNLGQGQATSLTKRPNILYGRRKYSSGASS
jgi:hypothetical protein